MEENVPIKTFERYLNTSFFYIDQFCSQLPVSLVDMGPELNFYNDDSYTMIECEVYFEPYYHVLKALQDPNFPEHLAMSSYIIDVEVSEALVSDYMYEIEIKVFSFYS